METKMKILNTHIKAKIHQLKGNWILKNSKYENDVCIQLNFVCEHNRYWDAVFTDIHIEIKKGKSIWLDEVRYSEILLCDTMNNDDCKKDTITMFIVPNKSKTYIDKIYLINTKKLDNLKCFNSFIT